MLEEWIVGWSLEALQIFSVRNPSRNENCKGDELKNFPTKVPNSNRLIRCSGRLQSNRKAA